MRYVDIEEACPNMVLAMNLYDSNNNILLTANTTLTPFFINRIKSMNYDGIYVYENDQIHQTFSIIDECTRIKAQKAVKKMDIDGCIYMANKIVKELQESGIYRTELVNLSSYDNYTYIHSVNVSILSTLIGIAYGLSKDKLELLSQAALLHDIGKSVIDLDILNKPGKLTDEEYTIVKNHSTFGRNILKQNYNISAVVSTAVYEHHENEDGSGYPRGVTGDKISLLGKIIHVADVYDALTAKRPYKNPYNPADAIEYLMANSGKMFDLDIVKTCMKCIIPYPVGTKVLLSNGDIARVKDQTEILYRPVIMVSQGYEIDLTDKRYLDLTIIDIVRKNIEKEMIMS